MSEQVKLFVGDDIDFLDYDESTNNYVHVPYSDGQIFLDSDSGKIYRDINGVRMPVSFESSHGDWGTNDPADAGYIYNRTHYIRDDGSAKILDDVFLPNAAAQYPIDRRSVFYSLSEAISAARNAVSPRDAGKDGYCYGQQILVYNEAENSIIWYEILPGGSLGQLGSSKSIVKTDVVELNNFDVVTSHGVAVEVSKINDKLNEHDQMLGYALNTLQNF